MNELNPNDKAARCSNFHPRRTWNVIQAEFDDFIASFNKKPNKEQLIAKYEAIDEDFTD